MTFRVPRHRVGIGAPAGAEVRMRGRVPRLRSTVGSGRGGGTARKTIAGERVDWGLGRAPAVSRSSAQLSRWQTSPLVPSSSTMAPSRGILLAAQARAARLGASRRHRGSARARLRDAEAAPALCALVPGHCLTVLLMDGAARHSKTPPSPLSELRLTGVLLAVRQACGAASYSNASVRPPRPANPGSPKA